MFRIIYLFWIALLLTACGSRKPAYHTETYKGKPILVGEINESLLRQKPYAEWFEESYRDYRPRDSVMRALKKIDWKPFRIEVYMGTWCPDSQEHVPVFLRILHEAGFPAKQVKIFALPRHYAQSPLVKGKHIIRVPTFIVYKNGKEAGRIIEYPMKSLEEDLLDIASGRPYVHDYQKEQ